MNKIILTFIGRKSGAIGKFHRIRRTLESASASVTSDQAIAMLYEQTNAAFEVNRVVSITVAAGH